MASSVIGGDIEKQKLRFYWALPVKRTNFMINKILVVLLISLVSLILIITAAFLIRKSRRFKGVFRLPSAS